MTYLFIQEDQPWVVPALLSALNYYDGVAATFFVSKVNTFDHSHVPGLIHTVVRRDFVALYLRTCAAGDVMRFISRSTASLRGLSPQCVIFFLGHGIAPTPAHSPCSNHQQTPEVIEAREAEVII